MRKLSSVCATLPLALLLLAVSSCGPAARTGSGTGLGAGKESAAAPAFPVTRRIPGNVTMFAATARLDQAAQLVRDLIKPLGRVENDADPANLDRELRRELGFSPISPADLADFGFAVDRNFAVFSTGLFPTLVAPIADAARVNERLGKLTAQLKIVVSEHRGVTLTVVRDGDGYVAWAAADDWLFVHLGFESVEQSTTTWLNEILDAKAMLAAEPDLEWAWQQAAGQKQGLGLVRGPALMAAARALDRAESKNPACDAMNADLVGSFGRVALSAALAEGKLDGRVFVELSAAASGALAGHVAGAPDAAYLGLREEAGFVLSAGIDLDWLGQTSKAHQNRDCGILPSIVRELDLDDLHDPLTRELRQRAFTSYHVALLGGSAGLGGVDVQAVGFMGVADEGVVRNLLAQLGNAQTAKVNGVDVQQVSIPGVAQPLEYTLGGGALRLGMGRGLIGKLLGGGAAGGAAGSAEILALAVRPDKLPDLLSALQLVGGRDAEVIARLLGEYKWIRGAIAAENGGVRVTGGFELR